MRRSIGLVLGLLLVLVPFAACGGGGGGGGDPPDDDGGDTGRTFAEAWVLTASGTCTGPFVCLTGTDAYYEEQFHGGFAIIDPLRSLVEGTTLTRFDGPFSQVELGIEASGQGCAPPPSIASSETGPVTVTFRTGFASPQIQISAASVLMPGHFFLQSGNEMHDSSFIVLDVTSIADARMTGTWRAEAASSLSATNAGGAFILDRVAVSASEVARVTISADQAPGFLAPGTVVQLTVEARDSNGNVVPCQPTYRFENPVGGSVNVIQGINVNGQMTIGGDQGAARVWAECDGVPSNLLLVSGTG